MTRPETRGGSPKQSLVTPVLCGLFQANIRVTALEQRVAACEARAGRRTHDQARM